MSITLTTAANAEPDDYGLLMGNSVELSAAGIEMGMVGAVHCLPPSPGNSPPLIIGRVRTETESATMCGHSLCTWGLPLTPDYFSRRKRYRLNQRKPFRIHRQVPRAKKEPPEGSSL